LHRQGIEQLDALLISHADNDHSGGAASLLAEIPVVVQLSSAAPWAEGMAKQYCRSGQSWQWENVQFNILSPPELQFSKENNNSCVLKIQTGKQSILLTGDIETPSETWLLEHSGAQLPSTILLAPHHGSKTSSSYAFLTQVNPKLILISAGHLNRFHFPHAPVLERYQQLKLPWLNTAEQGAISVQMSPDTFQVSTERQLRRRYWMASPPNLPEIE
jgi:competence protein ComEC